MTAADVSARRGNKFVLGLSTSPRRKGNSALVAQAILEGAAEAGHRTEFVHLPDVVTAMLRNCRECRRPDGSCSIDDGYRDLFLNKVLPADALVFATPIWWYGMSAGLKNYFDRMFCYCALSNPGHADVHRRVVGKRVALALSAEENNFSARLAIVQQVQELSRYMHYEMVGIVTGIGNKTGEAVDDPTGPIAEARQLGKRLFEIELTDYKLDTVRPQRIWREDNKSFPAYWR
jgi:multimeric flavodoxin WrbA